MKRVANLLLRLYPKAWRARYGDEIGGLLEDGPVRWRALPDLLCGAMKEQFNVQSFTRLVAWLAAAGLVAGFMASFAVTPRYTSHALISFNSPGASDILYPARTELMSRYRLAKIINNPRLNLYPEERTRIPMEDVENKMREDLVITTPDPAKALVAISFTYRDPAKAQAVTQNAIDTLRYVIRDFNREHYIISALNHRESGYFDEIARLESAIARLEKRPPLASTGPFDPPVAQDVIKIIDQPSLPAHPASPNRLVFAAYGFSGGIVAAFLVALLRRRPRPVPGPVAFS